MTRVKTKHAIKHLQEVGLIKEAFNPLIDILFPVSRLHFDRIQKVIYRVYREINEERAAATKAGDE